MPRAEKRCIHTFIASPPCLTNPNSNRHSTRTASPAPGPIWTPLIPSTLDAEHVAKFGCKEPLGRAGQPDEVAPCDISLASADASYMTGQTLHPNGGELVNG